MFALSVGNYPRHIFVLGSRQKETGMAEQGRRAGHGRQDLDLERLLSERGDQLIRAAIALTGSRPEGEDLLQAALERVLRHPRQVESDPEGYLRRTMYNLAADGWRRRGNWQRKLPMLRMQISSAAVDATDGVDLRDAIVRALRLLPPRQRTVIVLRYWEQRTEAETAALLGCSQGAVKSAASRGLQRLRELAGPSLALTPRTEERS
jgi:RNA polymerase sigma-70 factor (sigma-E family)